jgi:type IV pilus assembly protein PilA
MGAQMNRNRAQGFTLIELMIVVAILGILASIAISSYQTYSVRAQVSEGIMLANNAKTPVIEAYHSDGNAPPDRLSAGLTPNGTDSSGNYVESVDVQDGSLVITFGLNANAAIAGQTLYLTPYETSGGTIVWRCGNQDAPSQGGSALELMGTTSGGNVATFVASTVAARYLPSSCR